MKLNYKKKLCIFTTSRADYGLLRTFIKQIKNNKKFNSFVIATASHLEKRSGFTFKEIERDGIKIFKKINLNIENDTAKALSKSMATGIISFNKILEKINPDIIVILGDRIELLPICYAALLLNIPIAHFNGGESTEGSTDEIIRHAVSKLSHIHFPANQIYARRLVMMGESPKKVFNVGGTSIDNIKNNKLLSKDELERFYGFEFQKKNFLITFHSATINPYDSIKELKNLLNVLKKFSTYGLIFTGTNIDIKSGSIRKLIKNFIKSNKKSVFIESMGSKNYISAMKLCDVIIGNSSSGILEAPFFKKPVVNIGNRQKGRLKAINIISCNGNYNSIMNSINKCLNKSFIKSIQKLKNPYGNGNASVKAIKILEKISLDTILEKKFHEQSKLYRKFLI